MVSVRQRIHQVDRELLRFVGLASDPQACGPVNTLLDRRLVLMLERDRGYRFRDNRRVTIR